ncbi:MAG: molecular chaperone Tir [Deltaproteobacteria bacterium]|jgi:hypothetical protein|nr:molecular chaperone Tir [Deltaproteobacteria bacterium]
MRPLVKTYIAADWENDLAAAEQLRRWNVEDDWHLSFADSHGLRRAKDDSPNCRVKKAVDNLLYGIETFVLVVGDKTKSSDVGSCRHCPNYDSTRIYCNLRHQTDSGSFLVHECRQAVKNNLHVVVLYHAATVDKSKCPDELHDLGAHKPMLFLSNNVITWNCADVKSALCPTP